MSGLLMQGAATKYVPIMLNTYYPPNQPTPARCYELGMALRKALLSLPGDRRVALLASGGLSHFVVNPELDRRVLHAMDRRDGEILRSIPSSLLNSGSSEIRNWIVAAGAMDPGSQGWFEYIPAYRSPAGTGIGLAFGLWKDAA